MTTSFFRKPTTEIRLSKLGSWSTDGNASYFRALRLKISETVQFLMSRWIRFLGVTFRLWDEISENGFQSEIFGLFSTKAAMVLKISILIADFLSSSSRISRLEISVWHFDHWRLAQKMVTDQKAPKKIEGLERAIAQ
jgi:hypothetical protein